MYTRNDITPFSILGRKKYLQTSYGTEFPEFWLIVSNTLAQINLVNPKAMQFKKEDQILAFSADKNWINDEERFRQMLNGRIFSCPELGGNSARVETCYRYLFEEVYFGYSKNIKCFQGPALTNIKSFILENMYTLILTNFGAYHLGEEMR